jgi:hypothetical protein
MLLSINGINTENSLIKVDNQLFQLVYENDKSMTKTTVNISKKLLISIIIGFLSSFIFGIVTHVSQNKTQAMPGENDGFITYQTLAIWCTYECALGERHRFDCSGTRVFDTGDLELSGGEILSSAFYHKSTLLVIAIIISTLLYLFQTIRLKLT